MMPLHPLLIQMLNQTIDHEISSIPPFVKACRTEDSKNAFHLRNPEDFALGMSLGTILESFRVAFAAAFGRTLTPEEMLGVLTVVFNRANEIRSAIVGVSN